MSNEKSLTGEPALTESILRGIASTVDGGESTQSTAFTMQRPVSPGAQLEERYQLGEEIARGGMGAVHRAIDTIFRREVAVKLLLPKWSKESDLQRQEQRKAQLLEAFRYEAEITARLQHPGIPPVHELGRMSDGLPFLAMKLIQGQTLQELLAARASLQAELPRWLQIFEQIAQAVGYAHSRGILHRDLKPANVMVGAFGEVQVMDWGLSKAIGAAEREAIDDDDEPHDELVSSRQFASVRGDIKGTLAYMPPEQARGEIDKLDARADVFSLGAILCEILTGSPPYTGRTLAELKTQAAAANLVAIFTMLRASGADVDLIDLAIRCLSPHPAERPADGTAVAQAIATHRASVEQRLRRAETERALSEQRLVEQSRRRKLWYGIAAALALVVVISSTLAVVYARSNVIIADRELQATNAAALATKREGEATAAFKLATQREQLAKEEAAISLAVNSFLKEDLLSLAGADEQAAVGLKVDPDLKARELVLRAAARIDGKFAHQPRVEAETRKTLGLALFSLGQYAAAVKQSERVGELFVQLFGPEDPRTLRAMCDLGQAYSAAGELEKSVSLLEETLQLLQKVQGPQHPETLKAMVALASAYHEAGKFGLAEDAARKARELCDETLGPEHRDTQHAAGVLAIVYWSLGKNDEAIQLRERMLKLAKERQGEDHPDVLRSMHTLGLAYLEAGKYNLALPLITSSFELRKKKLGTQHPETLTSMNNLALAYFRTARIDRAEPLYEEALKLSQTQLGLDHPETLTTATGLANVYRAVGKLKQSISLLEDTLKMRRAKLGDEHPDTLAAMSNLANSYCMDGQFEPAIPLLKKALDASKAKLGDEHPNSLAFTNNLANAYQEAGQAAEALPLHEATLAIVKQKFGATHPRALGCLLGIALSEIDLKMYSEAEAHLQEVLDAARKLPAPLKQQMAFEAALEFIKLYEAWDKTEELARWREELQKYKQP